MKKQTKKDYKIVIGIATMNTRKDSLRLTLSTLKRQTIQPDRVIIYNNDENEFDGTDNSKFYYFETEEYKEDLKADYKTYFFSMDDDLLYDKNYIENTIKNIEKYKCYISYHGNFLVDDKTYYLSKHLYYGCTDEVEKDVYVDIPGTGVSAFDISYFKPEIFYNENKRMSDILIGIQVFEEDKKIVCLNHKTGFIVALYNDLENSCFMKERTNTVQNELTYDLYLKKLKKEKIRNNTI